QRQLEGMTPHLQLTTFSFLPLLQEIVDEAGDFWGRSRFRLVRSGLLPDMLSGDRMLLKTAVMNLLDNAVKYSPENSHIDVDLKNDGSGLVLAVSNAVAPAVSLDSEALFGKYVRGVTSAGHRGSGLGLYLVRQIARLHHGEARLSQSGNRVAAELSLPLSSPED
ncbi:MAG TPA: HAMP domain-containing sensor histidine kinase, partial [Desulfuromonadales bacterium]|nr:HAMP domain-containing sensor histidine kinase [Desulfuromonadales bacterium]